MTSRRLLHALCLLTLVVGVMVGLAVLRGYRLLRVSTEDMSPSVEPGDWLLIGPGPAHRGDIVRLVDPTDPARTVLRRVLAEPGERIGFTGHQPRLGGQALKHVVMGDRDDELVLMENDAWLLRVSLEPTRFQAAPVEIPDGQLFLVADHRDVTLDSRWWGPVPADAVRKVHLRFGPADVWRAVVFSPRQTVRPEIPRLPYQLPEELREHLEGATPSP